MLSRRIFANFRTSLSRSAKRSTSASSTTRGVLLATVETSVAMLSSSNAFGFPQGAALEAVFFAFSSCQASRSTLLLAASDLASALRSAFDFANNKQLSLAVCPGQLQRVQTILVLFAIVVDWIGMTRQTATAEE